MTGTTIESLAEDHAEHRSYCDWLDAQEEAVDEDMTISAHDAGWRAGRDWQREQGERAMVVFEGNVYIRPLGRGVCLGDNMIDFEDWIVEALGIQSVSAGGEDVAVRIVIERLSALVGAAGEATRG